MSNRATTSNLLVALAAFLFCMLVVPAAFGFGIGVPELLIWLGILIIGFVLIIRRHRRARADAGDPVGR